MASKKIYKHHERSTLAQAKADAVTRELVLASTTREATISFENGWFYDISQFHDVRSFGAVVDGTTDDSTAIAAAIVAAQTTNKPVKIPGLCAIGSTINIPAGICIVGTGWGVDPINAPTTRTSGFAYTGTGTALSVNGSNIHLRHIGVWDINSTAAVGLLLNGDTNAIESCRFEDVWLYGNKSAPYSSWTALEMKGINSGSVTYCDFTNLRIRNAKVGIYIHDTGGGTGFVNTNQFYGGAISGGDGIFDYAIRCSGGNDNRFFGISVEPYTSTYAHIHVTLNASNTGSIWFDGRVEAAHQPATSYTIYFGPGTLDSFLDSPLGISGWIEDLGKNDIRGAHPLSPKFNARTYNLFDNYWFENVGTASVPGWTITETGTGTGASSFATLAADPIEGFTVLKITVPSGKTLKFGQSQAATSLWSAAPLMAAAYIKTDYADNVQWSCQYGSGGTNIFVGGKPHPGDSVWRQIGVRADLVLNADLVNPILFVPNTSGTSKVIYMAAPSLSRGYSFPTQEPSVGSGILVRNINPNLKGTVSGTAYKFTGQGTTLGDSYVGGTLTVDGRVFGTGGTVVAASDIALGKGNYFYVSGTSTMNRIDTTGWRAPAEITLNFGTALIVNNNAAPVGTYTSPPFNAPFRLQGGTNYSLAANTTMKFLLDGTYWWETARCAH